MHMMENAAIGLAETAAVPAGRGAAASSAAIGSLADCYVRSGNPAFSGSVRLLMTMTRKMAHGLIVRR